MGFRSIKSQTAAAVAGLNNANPNRTTRETGSHAGNRTFNHNFLTLTPLQNQHDKYPFRRVTPCFSIHLTNRFSTQNQHLPEPFPTPT
jgi:hypothetical protein